MNYNPINSSHRSLGWVKFTFVLFLWIFVGFVNKAVGQEAYAVYNDKVLTFYYDTQRTSRTGTTYGISELSNGYPAWLDVNNYSPRNKITKVVFNSSFANYKPETCSRWFYECNSLTEIQDIDKYLKTDEVTDMSEMFYGCESLESLDVTKFNTGNVTDMSGMFFNCESLESLDVTKFNTGNVTNMVKMFSNCESLKSLDVTKFNTEKVTDMSFMFHDCKSLKSLDVTKFNTGNVTDMNCMFADCESLKSLDVTKFNTGNVTVMFEMFYYCKSLESLDVTKFNTEKVWNMDRMFSDCWSLTTILVDESNWKTDKVTSSIDMFKDSPELIGDKGTTYNSSKIDVEYAHIDEGVSNPGYLTTGKYKIFYNGIDDDNATLDTYTGAITEFINEEVTLVEPKKDGYEFTCWTGTTITGLTTPTKNVTISATEVGNRIYTAHWQRFVSKADITPLISLSKTYDCTSDVYTTAGKKLDGDPNNEDSYLEYTDQVTGETIRCLVKAEYVDANGDATASSVDAIGIKVSAVNDANGKQIIQIKNGGSYSLTEDYVFQDLIFDQTDGVKINPYVILTADFTPSYSDLLAEGNVFSTEKAFDGTADVAFSNNITNVPGINYQHPNIPCGDVFVNIISAKLIDNNNQPITEQGSGYGLEVVFELNNPDYIFENNTKTIALQYPANEVNGKITPATEDIEITFANVDADGCIVADASNEHFCKGKAVIEFTVAKGNPQNYSIEFDGGEISSQSGAITGNSIEIAVPKELLPDTYIGTIELADANGKSTGKLPLKVIVQLPYYTIVTLYNDVAAVNQLAGEFSAYKWTENGNEISGANGRILQHTFNKSSVYTAILTKTDGGSYETCPLDLSRVSVGNSTARLLVYPNPATQGNDITVEVSENYNPEANKQIYIYNLNGTLAKHLSSPQEINKVQLPTGNYSGVYIQNGEKVPFKLIVK